MGEILDMKEDIHDVKCMLVKVLPQRSSSTLPSNDDNNNVPSELKSVTGTDRELDSRKGEKGQKQRLFNVNSEVMNKKQPLSVDIPSYADKAKKVPEHGKGNDTDEGWTPAAGSRRNRSIIKGNRKVVSSLKGANQMMDIFVGRCDSNVTADILKTYIENEINIPIVSCSELSNGRSDVKAFKVSLINVNRDKLLMADLWPENIRVRKFFNSRNGRSK